MQNGIMKNIVGEKMFKDVTPSKIRKINNEKVTVLMGGISAERDVSLDSGKMD